uniref:Uncharacterized protein n=1 Tax=Glossina brevipalpis TaxID=37001 RepID=A0A1A9X0V5_9MUSC
MWLTEWLVSRTGWLIVWLAGCLVYAIFVAVVFVVVGVFVTFLSLKVAFDLTSYDGPYTSAGGAAKAIITATVTATNQFCLQLFLHYPSVRNSFIAMQCTRNTMLLIIS